MVEYLFGFTSVTLVTPGGELCYGTLLYPPGGGLATTTPWVPLVPQCEFAKVSFPCGPIRPQMARANAQGRNPEGDANWPTWRIRPSRLLTLWTS
jgi:hypothetical protein